MSQLEPFAGDKVINYLSQSKPALGDTSSHTLNQEMDSLRLAEVRSPGSTAFVHNLQQANMIAEEGEKSLQKFFLQRVLFSYCHKVNFLSFPRMQ